MSSPQQHIVQQGECLAKVARRYGFQNYRTIYSHPANGEYRKKRPNPNLIYPGDVIAIPAKEVKEVVTATGRVHRFVVPEPRKVLRVRMLDARSQPIANEAAAISVDGGPAPGNRKTDSEGVLVLEMPVTAGEASIRIAGQILRLELSHLNPVFDTEDEGASGVQQRLRNLGYYNGPWTGQFDRPTRLAIWLFQFDHGLANDGRPTPEMVRKLVAEHGC